VSDEDLKRWASELKQEVDVQVIQMAMETGALHRESGLSLWFGRVLGAVLLVCTGVMAPMVLAGLASPNLLLIYGALCVYFAWFWVRQESRARQVDVDLAQATPESIVLARVGLLELERYAWRSAPANVGKGLGLLVGLGLCMSALEAPALWPWAGAYMLLCSSLLIYGDLVRVRTLDAELTELRRMALELGRDDAVHA
jgi:hypothetical protein